ncbi:MAG: GTP 3',8-cyclase MoaA [Lachnospiraceae bacterium]|jgi:cyclic pyranopterin phosphate synthase|nr:GTP 3',8-cyclase MoaA [Lachnospiraceae bacterium]
MKDSYGRTIDYMRISITDRCNLRCRYCMPYGISSVVPEEILTLEEIQAVAMAGASLGIRHIKVTGGEPLTRKGCCKLIKMLKAVCGIEKVTITTNGICLSHFLESLAEAGIDGINISLDTTDRKRYQEITGTDGLRQVLTGLEQAVSKKIPVKINAVSAVWEEDSGQENDWLEVARLASRYPVDVRFIEMMPIGYGRNFKSLNHHEILERLLNEYPGTKKDEKVHGFGPAIYYQIPSFQGSIGFISAIHGKFCTGCNRIRITSQGYLKTCLCYEDGIDLRSILRAGQQNSLGNCLENGHWNWNYKDCPGDRKLQERLTAAISQAIRLKPKAHCFEQPQQMTEQHNMIDIGG